MVTRTEWNKNIEELLIELKSNQKYKKVATKLLEDSEILKKRAETKRKSNQKVKAMKIISGRETIKVDKRLKNLLLEAVELVKD